MPLPQNHVHPSECGSRGSLSILCRCTKLLTWSILGVQIDISPLFTKLSTSIVALHVTLGLGSPTSHVELNNPLLLSFIAFGNTVIVSVFNVIDVRHCFQYCPHHLLINTSRSYLLSFTVDSFRRVPMSCTEHLPASWISEPLMSHSQRPLALLSKKDERLYVNERLYHSNISGWFCGAQTRGKPQ